MDTEKFKHELRVACIRAWRNELSCDEAAAAVKSVLAKFQKDIAEAEKRVDSIIPHLCDKSITVNEAESEILPKE